MSTRPVLLDPPIHRFECPLCHFQAVTKELRPHMQMHTCAALNGYWTPMVEVHGIELSRKDGVFKVHDRGDYINGEMVRTDDDGRPIMAIDTVRPDGSYDRHVYAPTAVKEMAR